MLSITFSFQSRKCPFYYFKVEEKMCFYLHEKASTVGWQTKDNIEKYIL